MLFFSVLSLNTPLSRLMQHIYILYLLRSFKMWRCSLHHHSLKYKLKTNIEFCSANRKKAEARKTGGGPPPPPPQTEAEELALSQNRGHPVAEGIPGGSSSESVTPPGHKCLHQMQVYTYVFKKNKTNI